jgi:hypothetical protein
MDDEVSHGPVGVCISQSDELRGVEGHFNHPHDREWTNMTNHVHPLLAEIVGM